MKCKSFNWVRCWHNYGDCEDFKSLRIENEFLESLAVGMMAVRDAKENILITEEGTWENSCKVPKIFLKKINN